MEFTNKLLEVIEEARIISPDAWYSQRSIILKFIERIGMRYPNNFDSKTIKCTFNVDIRILHFGFKDEAFFWYDVILDDTTIECSGLEHIIEKRPTIKTRMIWNSDPDQKESYVTQFPISF